MRKLLSYLLVLGTGFIALSQDDAPTTYSSFFSLSGSKHEPAVLGDDFKNYHVSLVNAYVWAGNTTLNIDQVMRLRDGTFERDDVTSVFDANRNFHRFGFGANLDLMNVGIRLNKPDETELLTFSVGVSARSETNLLLSDNFFKLALRGNGDERFAGKKVDLPVEFNSFAAMEYHLGFAMPIPIDVTDFEFKGGLRLKYLQGIYSIYTEDAQFTLETEQDGRFIDLGYQYELHTTLDTTLDLESELGGGLPNAGTGFGADIGVTAHYKERWYGNINLLDIGAIKWTDEGTVFRNSGNIYFEGVEIDNIFSDDIIFNDSIFDEIIEEAEASEVQQSFRMPYPLRMRLHLSYKVPGQTSKGADYTKHMLGFTYIQGFRDLGNATLRPLLSAGYSYNLNNILEAGTNLGILGFNRVEAGLFLGVRGGPFRFGIGSGNVLSVIRSVGTGADINVNMTLAF